jgi:N-carbamoylputrescine amidase
LVVDAFGKRSVGPLSGTQNELLVVTIDLDDVARAQDRGSAIRPREDRRTDVYGLSYGEATL